MLEAIVLLWMAIKLEAPIWVFIIVVLMLVATTLSALLSVVEKIQKKKLKKLLDDFDPVTGTRKSETERREQK